jgi:Rrf2 family protein
MLSLTKKTDYALIALGFLAERNGQVVSAKQIADTFNLPTALVMNILKTLHHAGWLSSTRGTKGGYRLATDLQGVSVYDLVAILEGPVRLAECILQQSHAHTDHCKISGACPIQTPIKTLHDRLEGFLKDVKLSDIIRIPSERTHIPLDLLHSA